MGTRRKRSSVACRVVVEFFLFGSRRKKKIREEVALWTRVMVGGGERATDDQDVVTRDKCPPKDRLYSSISKRGQPHPSIHPVRTGCGRTSSALTITYIHPAAAAAAVICFTAVHIQLLLMSRLFLFPRRARICSTWTNNMTSFSFLFLLLLPSPRI